VTVYVGAPLCPTAEAALSAHPGEVGNFRVAAICLPASGRSGGGVDLATAGANARRATEDTSAVALIEPPGPATKFIRPIIETASVPLVMSRSGEAAMDRTLKAIGEAGSSSVRDEVQEALEPS
jgi:hypothetical protein